MQAWIRICRVDDCASLFCQQVTPPRHLTWQRRTGCKRCRPYWRSSRTANAQAKVRAAGITRLMRVILLRTRARGGRVAYVAPLLVDAFPGHQPTHNTAYHFEELKRFQYCSMGCFSKSQRAIYFFLVFQSGAHLKFNNCMRQGQTGSIPFDKEWVDPMCCHSCTLLKAVEIG
jgi:hypothetical protein